MPQLNDTLYGFIDTTDSKNTGLEITYNIVTQYYDGSAMDDSKCDGVIYRKKGTDYLRRNFDGIPSASWFGVTGDGADHSDKINSALSFDHIRGLKFDATDKKAITISDEVAVPDGKILRFENDNYLTGTGSLSGEMIIECNYRRMCLDTGIDLAEKSILNDKASLLWVGGVADAVYPSAGTDNAPLILKLETALQEYGKIYIPASTVQVSNGMYYGCSSFEITKPGIELIGDGHQSVLKFNGAALGIKLSAIYNKVKDLVILGWYGGNSTGYNSTTAHGLWHNGGDQLDENVEVYNFDGSGILIYGDVGGGSNTNLTKSYRAKCYGNGRAGIEARGGDGNAFTIEGYDCRDNGRFAIWDASFLGGAIGKGHSDGNGTGHPLTKTTVSYLGHIYSCWKSPNAGITGILPTNTDYWKLTDYGPHATAYDAGATYFSGGSMCYDGNNQQSGNLLSYSEGNETRLPRGEEGNLSITVGGFLCRYGLERQSIGVRSGYISQQNLMIYNEVEEVGIIIDATTLKITYADEGRGKNFGWKFHPSYGFAIWSGGESPSGRTYLLTDYANIDGGISDSTEYSGRMAFYGMWLGREDVGDFRRFSSHAGLTLPTAIGERKSGDIMLNGGTNCQFIAVKCITSGSSGTWIWLLSESSPITVSYGASVTPNAASSTKQRITLTGNITINAPSNPIDGQKLCFQLKQDGTGSRTATWDSIFRFPTGLPTPTLSTAANAMDRIEFEYNADATKWDCVNIIKGY